MSPRYNDPAAHGHLCALCGVAIDARARMPWGGVGNHYYSHKLGWRHWDCRLARKSE